MIRAALLLAGVWFACGAAEAQAPRNLDHDAALSAVAADNGCRSRNAEDVSMVTCDQGRTWWYFTVPGRTEHPGYVWRGVYMRDGAWAIDTYTRFDGDDGRQAAFRDWTKTILKRIGVAGMGPAWPPR
jgi:hypothetical protein